MKKWLISYSSYRRLSDNDLREISFRLNCSVEFIGKADGKKRCDYSLHSDKLEELTENHFVFLRDKGIIPFLYHQRYDKIVERIFSGLEVQSENPSTDTQPVTI